MAIDIYISNPTPQNFPLGTNEQSGVVQSVVETPRPMFMPFFQFWAEKGTLDEVVVDGTAFAKIYGTETLNENSPYFNHASAFIKGVLEDGGTILAKRVVPENATNVAAARLYLEYVKTNVDERARSNSGTWKKTALNEYETTGRSVPGILYRFVVGDIKDEVVEAGGIRVSKETFGTGAEEIGDLSDGAGAIARRIPLLDFAVSSPGAWGNRSGLSIWAPVENDSSPINHIALNDTGSYPFRIQVVSKSTPTANPVVATTVNGARELDFCLKPRARSKSGVRYHLSEMFVKEYNDLAPLNPLVPPTYGPFSRVHVYQENIDEVLAEFTKIETDAEILPGGDFDTTANSLGLNTNPGGELNIESAKYLFNLFGGTHSNGRPYQTFRLANNSSNSLGSDTIIWAQGGSDGDMTDAAFNAATIALMDEMFNENGKYMDDVSFNDSTFIDSGFPMDVKDHLGKYISPRKDRWVLLGSSVAGESNITPAEENARVARLRSSVRLYPDSALFGTAAYRACILKGHGRLLETVSSYDTTLPITYELTRMLTKYWGRQLGTANTRYDFTEGDNHFFKYMTDVSNSWTPYQVRNKAWAAGAMWSMRNERKRSFFPMFRTVFDDDSSTLMNLRIMLVHVELNKIGAEQHRKFAGKDWPDLRFTQEMTADFYDRIKDNKFGGKVEVEYALTLTELDKELGWSWHSEATVYGDNFKTVQTFHTNNMRRSQKPENSGAIIA